MAFLSGLEMVFFTIMLAFILAWTVPLTGTLVRFRASYNPRGLALDAEGGAEPFAGPVVNSYFAMFARVYRIEVSLLYIFSSHNVITRYHNRAGRAYTRVSVSFIRTTMCRLLADHPCSANGSGCTGHVAVRNDFLERIPPYGWPLQYTRRWCDW
jgi:hypothetical protein